MIAVFKEKDLNRKLAQYNPISFRVNRKKLMLKELAEISDMALETIKSRFINNNDITLRELVAPPTCRSQLTKVIMWEGQYRNYKDISRMEGIPYGTLIGRLRTGRSLEEAINFKRRTPVRPNKAGIVRKEKPFVEVKETEMYHERNLIQSLVEQGFGESEIKAEVLKRGSAYI